MPWQTPTLKEVRSLVRDSIRGSLPGADALVPNSVLRVLSDSQGALCHLTLQYVDWLALQLLPDTAETEWLDRHGDIWLVNADGTTGRKLATLAYGTVAVTASFTSVVIPKASRLVAMVGAVVEYETIAEYVTGDAGSTINVGVRAIDSGSIGNLDPGLPLAFSPNIPGIDTVEAIDVDHGVDEETDDELRMRILARIRQPPMGGDADDYVNWALRVPGVTRAWCAPQEMGMGTVTVRFMMDDLRASNGGFPLPSDVDAVTAYLNTVRPVTVKDFFVESPIPYPINLNITWLDVDDDATRSAITSSLLDVFYQNAAPGKKWYRAWTDQGIMNASGVVAYEVNASDADMPSLGHMAVLGDISYG